GKTCEISVCIILHTLLTKLLSGSSFLLYWFNSVSLPINLILDLSSGGAAQAWTYNYSTIPSRRWPEARQWCLQHFTDMVPIRNKEESDFINDLLPFNTRYYWIGIVKKDGEWIWQDTSEKVPKEAQNWAPEEPDNIADQNCVEIYIKREKDTAKWNNESCRKKKGTVCYATSCRQDSCSANADCVETIGNYTCQCHPGFLGSRCEEEQGSYYCFNPYGSNRFNSSCRFHCELGFQLVGVPQLLCQASGHWNHPVPLCQGMCSPVFFPVTGNVTCVDPLEPFSFGSRCNFTCQEGYYPTRDNTFTCLASGQQAPWKQQNLKAPPNAFMQCQDPRGVYSYGSICSVLCEEGFDLIGTNMTKCSSEGNWSHALPVCQAKRCPTVNSFSHGSLVCSDPHGEFSFGSRCTSTCEEGFLLNGTADTQCTSLGTWSTDIPRCNGKSVNLSLKHIGCPALSTPSNGSLVCSDPHGEFSFGSQCKSTCEEGFLLNGTADTECTSLGMWSADIPGCLVFAYTQPCPLLAKAPQNGRMNCSHPYSSFSFGSHCDFECDEGFWLRGTQTMTCNNSGHWSQDLPTCQESQGITKIRIHHLGTMHVCTNFQRNPSDGC
uniref:E-selectin n=1 Tax=Sander lucioperca TaxID=283035 RepID=A0A8C9ZDM3_SANLU